MTALIIGLCLIIFGWRLFTGDAGRVALLASVVVGAYVKTAADLAEQGVDVLAALGGAVQQLGSIGNTAAVIAAAAAAVPLPGSSRPAADEDPPPVDLDTVTKPQPPTYVVDTKTGKCACGKNGTPEAHGWIGTRIGFTCAEVRTMRNLREAAERRQVVRRGARHFRARLRDRVTAWADRLLGEDEPDEATGGAQ